MDHKHPESSFIEASIACAQGLLSKPHPPGGRHRHVLLFTANQEQGLERVISNIRKSAQSFVSTAGQKYQCLGWMCARQHSPARPAGRAPAAITFLQANLTENVAAAGEAEPRRGVAGLAEAGVAEHGHGHGAAGQAQGLGQSRLSSGRAPRVRPRHVPPAEAAPRAARPAPLPPRGLRAAELGRQPPSPTPPSNLVFLASHYQTGAVPTQRVL